jgi:hypothetical protein
VNLRWLLVALGMWLLPAAHASGLWAPAQAGLGPAGEGRLSWMGLRVYDARLWVTPEFRHREFARHRFALELQYRRSFRGADIASRSLQEMLRAGPIDAPLAQRWRDELARVLPDVREGDRIAGLHEPGAGLTFIVNGSPAGRIADPVLAERFFGIWLAASTSEPGLRDALVAGTPP